MFLSDALNADTQAIIDEGKAEPAYNRVSRAHRLYVRYVHDRKWDATTATAVYWAWHAVVSKLEEDDIPF